MLKTNTNQKGFTIVELLIVIVVIGILAMLVLNTFSGVQQKARDTERQTDATSVAKQLEAYFAQNGGYPLTTQFVSGANDAAKITAATTLLKGTSDNAYTAPSLAAGTFSWITTGPAANKDNYSYVPASCTAAVDSCQSFVITYFKENGGVQTIKSLN